MSTPPMSSSTSSNQGSAFTVAITSASSSSNSPAMQALLTAIEKTVENLNMQQKDSSKSIQVSSNQEESKRPDPKKLEEEKKEKEIFQRAFERAKAKNPHVTPSLVKSLLTDSGDFEPYAGPL